MGAQLTRGVAAHERLGLDIALPPPLRITPNFVLQSERAPWLREIWRSVGRVTLGGNVPLLYGSAVLLDDAGTLALCDHETSRSFPLSIQFLDSRSADGFSDPIRVEQLWANPDQDLAFGRMSPDVIGSYGLKPITWATRTPYGRNAFAVGFPGEDGDFNAERGTAIETDGIYSVSVDKQAEHDRIIFCNASAQGFTEPGESGCPVFEATSGAFIGVHKAGGFEDRLTIVPKDHGFLARMENLHFMTFTPVEAVYQAYKGLFGTIAARRPIRTLSPTSAACRFDRRHFIALSR